MIEYNKRVWYVDQYGHRLFVTEANFAYEVSYSKQCIVVPILLHWHYTASPSCVGFRMSKKHTLSNKSVIIEDISLIGAPLDFLLNNNFIRE